MRRSAAGAAGLGFFLNGKWLPLEAAPVVARPRSPSERVGVGFLGVGIRGHILMEAAKATGQANLVVACDCYQGHLDRAKERTEFFECVRSRKECSENAEIGHYAAAAGHMVNLSSRTGKKVFWDAAAGTVKA